MSVRNPIVFWIWILLFTVGIIAAVGRVELYLVVFIASPMLALAALAAMKSRYGEELRRGWVWPYRVIALGLALAGVAGLVGSSARGLSLTNAPMALLFLLATILGWRAFIQPSPKRGAQPAAVLHVLWVPLLIANSAFENHSDPIPAFQSGLLIGGVFGMLLLSALTSFLSSFTFVLADRDRLAAAQLR